MSQFVLDASVALAWVLDNPIPEYATRVRQAILSGKRALVPTLWHLEIANGLVTAERRRDLTNADVEAALEQIQITVGQAIDTDESPVRVREILASAQSHRLTAYDAVYLDLALRERLPLATLDKGLRAAATKAGIRPL